MPSSPENPSEPPIHRAARRGDVTELTRLLDAGADVNERADLPVEDGLPFAGVTPLMAAACSVEGADVATLAFLIERGADLRATQRGSTAAWFAAGGDAPYEEPTDRNVPDRVDRLRFLLDAGLDAREGEGEGDRRSLLAAAANAGDSARVRLLIERGALPGAGDDSPLHDAARSGSAECVRLLLEAGADVNEPDGWFGRSPLASARSAEVVRVLVAAGASLEGDPLSAVFAAIDEEDPPFPPGQGVAVARALLDAGASLEETSRLGWSRLTQAAFREQDEAVAFLLECGASLDPDTDGANALHHVCWQGEHNPETDAKCERIIRLLVAAGISPDAPDGKQGTPLTWAIGGDWSNPTAVWTLLALGATVDAPDAAGRTALYYAASKGDIPIAEALLYAGANLDHADYVGETPRDRARLYEELTAKIDTGNWPPPPPPGETADARLARLDAGLRAFSAAYAVYHAQRSAAVRRMFGG